MQNCFGGKKYPEKTKFAFDKIDLIEKGFSTTKKRKFFSTNF